MRTYSWFQRIGSLLLSIVLTLSMAMPYLSTVNASNNEEAAIKIGWKELGITEDTTYSTIGTHPIGNSSNSKTDTFSSIEFEEIIHITSGGKLEFAFGGREANQALQIRSLADERICLKWNDKAVKYINYPDGTENNEIITQPMKDVDLIVNIQMAFTAKDDTKSSGNFTVTFKDALTGEQLYSGTFKNREINSANLVPNAWAKIETASGFTAKTVRKIGWTDLSVTEDTTYTTPNTIQTIGTPVTLTDTISWMEFDGIIHVGSTAQTKFGFGGSDEAKGFYLQVNQAGTAYLKWNNGQDKVLQNINFSGTQGSPMIGSLQDVDLQINIKMGIVAIDTINSKVSVTVTLTNPTLNDELYNDTFYNDNTVIATEDLKARAWTYIRENNTEKNGALTVKPSITETKKIGWSELGITENMTYTTSGQCQPIGTPLTGTFSNMEFEGIIHLASTEGKVQLGFGGSDVTKAFCIQGNADGSVYLKWNGEAIKYINKTEQDGPMLSQNLQDVDLIINVKMMFANYAMNDNQSIGNITVTLKDAATETELYSEIFRNKTIETATLAANAWVSTEDNGKLIIKNTSSSGGQQTEDWECGETVSVSGSSATGYDVTGGERKTAHYLRKLKPEHTTLSFKVNSAGAEGKQTVVIAMTENISMGLVPDAEEMKESKAMVLTIEQKMDETILSLVDKGHKSQILEIATFTEFDYEATHTLTFKNEYGNWYTVFDGEVLRSQQLNKYMENMLNAEEGLYYRFTGWQAYTFKNVQFLNTPADTSATSNWDVVGYEMSGESDNLTFEGNGYASWKNTVDLTKSTIKVQFNTVKDGSIRLTLADIPMIGTNPLKGLVLPEAEENAITFLFARENDTDLYIRLYGTLENGKQNGRLITRVRDFNFDVQHEIRFVERDGNYYLALDGQIFAAPSDDGDNKYITTAITDCLKKVGKNAYLRFADEQKYEAQLKNISFVEEEFIEFPWEWGKSVTVSRNDDIGYDVTGEGYRTAHYVRKLKAEHTTLSFKLKSAGAEGKQTVVVTMTENPSMDLLPDAEEMKEAKAMVLTIEQKPDKTILSLVDKGHKNQVLELGTFTDFNYDATHTLTFKNEYGNWYIVFDGKVLRSQQLNKYMENMLAAEDGLYYRFTGWQDYSFTNVQFLNTPTDTSATSNWDVVGYEMSGKGDNLTFTGKGYASWKKPVDLMETTIRLQFKTVKGGSTRLTVADIPMIGTNPLKGLMLPEAEENAITFLFAQENDTDLYIRLYGTLENGKQNGRLITRVRNFNFDVPHDLRFVERDGNYYLALDGQILQWPKDDGDSKYITTAINDCLSKVGRNAYLRFADEQKYGTKWDSISFIEEPFVEAEIFIDGSVEVNADKNGLSAVGKGTMGINKKFDIINDKLIMEFHPTVDNWIAIVIGDTASTMIDYYIGSGNDHNMMSILLERDDTDNQLNIYFYDKENGKERLRTFMRIKYFDFDKAHTFSFVEHRGKYYLAIDDRMIEAVAGDGENEIVTTWVTKCVKALSKTGAYIRLVSPKCLDVSNVSWKGMGTVNGVEIVGIVVSNSTTIERKPTTSVKKPVATEEEKPTVKEEKPVVNDEEPTAEEEKTTKVNFMLVLPIIGTVVLATSIVLVVGWNKRSQKRKKK